jgi:RNA polymerase sigma-70 factor (ECF subfamily)
MENKNLTRLIDKYSTKVYNLAYRITGNKCDAEDIVQDTFLDVYNNIDKFRGESKVYTWIYKIALNNSLKKKKEITKDYITDKLDEKIEQFADEIPPQVREWSNNPEKAYLINELVTAIRRECMFFMTNILTEDQRTVYILKNVLDFSYEEISELLDISKEVIKARLNRARKNLVDHFKNRCKWIDPNNPCTCKSRVGFGLVYDPEILRRVEMMADSSKATKEYSTVIFKDDSDIDNFYKEMLPLDFDNQILKDYLNIPQ